MTMLIVDLVVNDDISFLAHSTSAPLLLNGPRCNWAAGVLLSYDECEPDTVWNCFHVLQSYKVPRDPDCWYGSVPDFLRFCESSGQLLG